MRRLAMLAVLAGTALPAWAQESAADLFRRPEKGDCLACHQVPAVPALATRSDLGPALTGERMRALGKAKLREVIVDPTQANPATVMPPFGRHNILEAGEIQRLVDFLHALP